MKEELIPIVMFVCIVYAIKVVVDALARRHMLNSGTSPELVASLLRNEEQRQRHSSLRWGIVLVALAIGFGIIQWAGWTDLTPGMIAVLAGVTGLGNLAFFTIARRLG
jgi:CHASE2 domain-containing sensor protein